MLVGTAARTAFAISRRKAHAVLERAAVLVGALVRHRRQKACSEIAVGEMQFDGVEADPHRALRGVDEGLAHPRDVVLGHGARGTCQLGPNGIAEGAIVSQGSSPAVSARRPPRAAARTPCGRHARSGCRAWRCRCCRQWSMTRASAASQCIGIKPEAAVGDAATPLDMGRLDDHEPGAGIRQHAEMRHDASRWRRRRRRCTGTSARRRCGWRARDRQGGWAKTKYSSWCTTDWLITYCGVKWLA